MRKKIFIGVLLLLLMFNTFLILKSIKADYLLEEAVDKYLRLAVYEEQLSTQLKEHARLQHEMESVVLPDIWVDDIGNQQKVSFRTLCQNDSIRLFFRFKETHCDACIQSTLGVLKEMLAKNENLSVDILCSYLHTRHFLSFAHTWNQKMNVYNVESLPWKNVEKVEAPYFFIVKNGETINNLFITIKEDKQSTEEYMNVIIEKYYKPKREEVNLIIRNNEH